VISCNWRAELDWAERDDRVLRGVKNRVKRLGVMGGGRFCLRAAVGAGGGDDERRSSGWNATRGAHGDDDRMLAMAGDKMKGEWEDALRQPVVCTGTWDESQI
jgi:hypothetical protein